LSELVKDDAPPRGIAARGRRATVFLVACGALALVAIGGLAYENALDAGFVYDDLVNITQRSSLRWTRANLASWVAAIADSPSKRPVALATFGLQYRFGLGDARSFHAINVAIHLANGLLAWALAWLVLARAARLRAPGERAPRSLAAVAFVAALVFVVHPVQTQSVTYVVQRMSSLSATFHLLALIAYVLARRSPSSGRRALLFAGGLFAFGCGLGSKETAAVAPVAAWLYEWYFERDLSREFLRQSAIAAIFVGAPTAVAGYVMLEMSGYQPFANYPEKDFTALERLWSEPRVLALYASQLVWPAPSRLSLLHDIEVSRGWLEPPTTLPAIAAVLAALAGCAMLARRHRVASFGIAFWFLELAMESTVLPLALAMEHRHYLPLFGASLAVASVGADVLRSRPRLAMSLAGVAISALALATHARNEVWQTPERIWLDVLSKYPNEFTALVNLGFDLSNERRYAEALAAFERANALRPDDTRIATNLGTALAGLGRADEAIAQFERAIALDPTNELAPRGLGRVQLLSGRVDAARATFEREASRTGAPEAWLALGDVELVRGDVMAARRAFLRALRASPYAPEPAAKLGIVAARTGDHERAIIDFARAISLSPTPNAELYSHLALAYWSRARATSEGDGSRARATSEGDGSRANEREDASERHRDELRALAAMERALALAPDWVVAQNNLAWMLATADDPRLRAPERALALVEQALRASPDDLDLASTHVAALAAAGQPERARAEAERAAARAEAAGNAALARSIRARADGAPTSGSRD